MLHSRSLRSSLPATKALALALAAVLAAAISLAFATTALASPQEDLPNSWRYSDGQLIEEGGDATLLAEGTADGTTEPEEPAFIAWSETPRGFINSKGNLIEGALRNGIDVSEWNKEIDWAAVKAAGIDYAIIRCGYGSDYEDQDDKYFFANVQGAIENGIDVGIYLYSYAYNEEMAASEAAHVLRLLEAAGLEPDDLAYPVYYDLEEQGKTDQPCIRERNPKYDSTLDEDGNGVDENGETQFIHNYLDNETLGMLASTFAGALEEKGYEVGMYANLNWWRKFLTDPAFDQWERWVAQYNHECSYTGSYSMWQCTSSGSVDGIAGRVDLNFDYDVERCAPVLPDVNVESWYYTGGAYTYVMSRELMTGYSDTGLFGPYNSLTRGQVVTILWRMAGEPEVAADAFEDVNYDLYYGDAISWARATGVVVGYPDKDGVYRTFKPNKAVTRQELCVMFCNYARVIEGIDTGYAEDAEWVEGTEGEGETVSVCQGNPVSLTHCASEAASYLETLAPYPDAAKVPEWAAESMAWCVDAGIITGVKVKGVEHLKPSDKAWRASMAVMVHRYQNNVALG